MLKQTIKMSCEKCKKLVHTMVAVPRRRKKDGTIICFWNLCKDCAREVLNAGRKRITGTMSKMRKTNDDTGRYGKKPDVLRPLRPLVRVLKGDNKSEKNSKSSRYGSGLSGKSKVKRSNKLRDDIGSAYSRRKKKNIGNK